MKAARFNQIGVVNVVTNEYKHPEQKFSSLPQHEFSLIIVASKGSGKTNLLCNLLLNHYKGYFHGIHICSPSALHEAKWRVVRDTPGVLVENHKLNKALNEPRKEGGKLVPKVVHATAGDMEKEVERQREQPHFDGKIPDDSFFDDLDSIPQRLQAQRDTADKLKEMGYTENQVKGLLNRVLVIEDDMAGLYADGSKRNPLTNFVFKHRHYGASIVKIVQEYKSVPAGQRKGMNAIIIFEIPNAGEQDRLYEEWPMNMSRERWQAMYEYATKEEFNFLYFNSKFPKGQRLYKNFDEQLAIREEPAQHGDKQEKVEKEDKSHKGLKKLETFQEK